jgi:hypothetical protein
VELCPDASYIASYEKKEGEINRVFIFTTDNAQRIVPRLPFALAGPARLTTNSEVATIKYRMSPPRKQGAATDLYLFVVQAKTSIPIPTILDWSDDPSDVVGSEYIIMEHAHGVPLYQRWPTMGVGDQLQCIKSLYGKLKGIDELEFPAYGSLYFADTTNLTGPMIPVDDRFCIGPHCGASFWDCNAGQPRYYHQIKANHGPCEFCCTIS